MLSNNVKAPEAVLPLSPEEIRSAIGNLRCYADPSHTLSDLASKHKGGTLLAALTNNDSDELLNTLLIRNPSGIAAGFLAVQKAFDMSEVILILREDLQKNDTFSELISLAGKYHLTLKTELSDIVDTRKYKNALMLSFEDLAAAADILTGQTPGIILRINGGEINEYPFGTTPSALEGTDAKAVFYNHHFHALPFGPLSETICYGSGVINTIADDRCLIRFALDEIRRQKDRCCGKCTFCREGMTQLEYILKDVTLGKTRADDMALLAELSEAMSGLCSCSLGNTAAGPVASILESFQGELKEHIDDHVCRAEECDAFTTFIIDPSKCKGDHNCAAVCEAQCIDIKNGYTSVIDEFDCTRCGACLAACEKGAVIKATGSGMLPEQKKIRIRGAAGSASEALGDELTSGEERSRRKAKRTRPDIRPFKTDNVSAEAPAKTDSPATQIIPERREIMEHIETDVIVVAGGPAGLAAAVTLGEHGLKSILFEKSSTTGGAANMGMGILGIDTHIQKENFNSITVDEALDNHMKYTHYQVDADLVQTYFNKSASTIEWLESLGVEFAGAFRYFKESEATWHIVKPDNGIIGPRAAGKMARILTEKARQFGCDIRLETPAVDLITEDGKVCGVIAKDKDDNYIEARAKAVVIATGGFGNNKEMIYEKFRLRLGEDYFPFCIPGLEGDGLKMMWKAGAAEFGTNIETIYQLPDNASWSVLDGMLRQPNLFINQLGERFMNEGEMGNTTFTGNALRLQPGHYGYCIMDDGILRLYKKKGPDIISLAHSPDMVNEFDEQAEKAVKQGYNAFFEAATIPELAEKLGIDPDVLQDTIDEYNEMCESGVDTKFHKKQRYLHPITGKGKYYAGKFYLGAYGTMGGVRINKYCEVLDEDCMPIEGLYAAGTDANTIYGDSYNFTLPGNSMGFAVNSGRMAAESIAEYIKDNF